MAARRALFIALAITWVAALAGLVWLMAVADARLHHIPDLLIGTNPLTKVCVILSVASTVAGVISAFVGARSRPMIGVGGAFGWGALGALYAAANARNMLINMNPPIPFAVYAPNYAAALIALFLGVTGAILCLGLLALQKPS